MPRITRIYTRGGDKGTTSLGGGQRVKKHTLRIGAFGDVDELNSQIGVAAAGGLDREIADLLAVIQNELFHLGSDLCILEEDKVKLQVPQIGQQHVEALETVLDRLTEEAGPLDNFVLPGGTPGAARLHLARTICRRAERRVVELAESEPIGRHIVQYLNRLSDALFVMARIENKRKGVDDVLWDSRR
jgi:cob(I)alamin adenosyltransferase